MIKHELLKKKALDAVEELFGDTSVSQDQTRDSLNEIKDEINHRLDAIAADQNED